MPPKRKADAAATAPASKKTKTGGAGGIPVEAGLVKSNPGMSSAQVHGDYAYLANQVNIGANNNKFYRGQVVCNGGKFYSWTRWGRVGEDGQNALAGPMDEPAAVTAFEKKFKDKTGQKWAGNKAEYGASAKGKYTVIFESHDDSGQAAKLDAASAAGVKVTVETTPVK